MTGFSRLAYVETKLFLREKAATLAVFGLPVALVIAFGLIPGFGQPQKSLSDQIGTFLAGVYIPSEEMSSTMRQVGNFTPLGSALHAVRDSWMGLDPRPEYLGIMAAYAVIAGALAARFFRWEQA
jgi:ABC-2 type transport system permease protein